MSGYVLTGRIGEKTCRFVLVDGTATLGRSVRCEIPLLHPGVSRRHARIRVENGGAWIRDLGSRNGTYVNGGAVGDETRINPGDEVRIGGVRLRLVMASDPDSTWPPTEATPPLDDTSAPSPERGAERLRYGRVLTAIYDAGRMLSRSMELEEVYDSVLGLVEKFIPVSRIFILGYEEGCNAPPILASRIHEGSYREPLRLSCSMLQDIMIHGRPVIAGSDPAKASDSFVSMGIQAAMGAPLLDDGRVLGAVYVDSRRPGLVFREEDLDLLTMLANMVAVKIRHHRHEDEQRAYEAIRAEIALAERIQMRLLPDSLPEIAGYDLFALLEPCERVAGDLYEIRPLSDGRVWVSLGDVSGHGVGAALLMSHVMAGLRFLEDHSHDPAILVEQLETMVSRHVEPGQYLTLFSGILNPESGRLRFVNAGQWPPVLLSEGAARPLDTPGVPVALLPEVQERECGECRMERGSALVLFSDGIPETGTADAMFQDGRMEETFGRIRAKLGDLTAADIGHLLLREVEEYRGARPAADDLTLVVLKRL